MTGYLTHDANLARLDDMRIRAGRRPTTSPREEHTVQTISIRRAAEADGPVIERLAGLDSSPTPTGAILIAEVNDEPQAAMQIATGVTVANPFRPTANLVELLSHRAASLRESSGTSRRFRLRQRRAQPAA